MASTTASDGKVRSTACGLTAMTGKDSATALADSARPNTKAERIFMFINISIR
jgi:hypothetical protein